MSIDNWSFIFKSIGYLGAILVVISTIASSIISDKQDGAKDEKIDRLVKGNEKLISDIEIYKQQLDSKQNQLDKLTKKSVDASIGVIDFFTYSGDRKSQTGSRYQTVTGGEETQDFARLSTLLNDEQWPTLINESSKTIFRVPKWLTPYFLRAIGHASLGDLASAKKDLEHVTNEAESNPDYAQAHDMLHEVERQLGEEGK